MNYIMQLSFREGDLAADRDLCKLDKQVVKRILKFLHERIAQMEDPPEHWRGAERGACKTDDAISL